jgi:Ca2+-binding RTX toxin-like protein
MGLLATTQVEALATVPVSYQLLTLGNGNDRGEVTGSGRFKVLGLNGNDTISVRAGTTGGDYLDGGAGNDTLTAAESDDILDGGAGTDKLYGGAGNDVLRGGAGADTITGGEGIDTADYSTSGAMVTISLNLDPSKTTRGAGGDASGDTLLGIENLTGSAFNDVLSGNGLANQLIGMMGNDVLRGNDGDDLLIGDTIVDVDGNAIPDDDDADGIPDGVNDSLAGGNDTLDGGFGNDRIFGGGGNDTLLGGFGADQLYGGTGDDLLTGGDDADLLDGGDGDDQLISGFGDDILRGGAGADMLNASSGADLMYGGDGDDDLNGGDGADQMFGDAGNDTFLAGAGADLMSGGDGDDRMDGGDGDDVITGEGGNDRLIGGAGADLMDGGDGIDTADYSAGGAVGIDMITNTTSGAATGDSLVSIENLIGSAFDDVLAGNSEDNTLTGGAGGDTLIGQSGFDTADYSASTGAVTVQFNSTLANPTAAGTGLGGDAQGDTLILIERLVGSAFADTFLGGELGDTFVGGGGADVLTGNGGVDTAEYSTSSAGVTITLDPVAMTLGIGGDAEGDQLTGIENVIGSAYADLLRGGAGANRLDGGAGDDTLAGGADADRLIGGAGTDTADYSASASAVGVALFASDDPNLVTTGSGGDAQGDQLSGIENLIGSAFNDTLQGSAVANRLEGGIGNDLLRGQGGADILLGGAGTDTASYSTSASGVSVGLSSTGTTLGSGGDAQGDQLNGIENLTGSAFADLLVGSDVANRLEGGAGNDTLRGGIGADILVGGDGIDTADYSTSSAGVSVTLTANPAAATVGSGGDAAGDQLNTIENVTGSAFTDTLIGSTGNNKLVSGAGSDIMRGGSGSDLLVANGSGSKTLYGDGVNDGGTAGVDTFRILGGTNLIMGYQTGEDVQLNSLTQAPTLTQVFGASDPTLAVRLVGATHTTYVVVGSLTDLAAAQTAAGILVSQDLFVDPGLIV